MEMWDKFEMEESFDFFPANVAYSSGSKLHVSDMRRAFGHAAASMTLKKDGRLRRNH
jgi:hypothetical protein